MTDVVRLALVSHGATEAVREARFPADESLNSVGLRDVAKCAPMTAERVLVAPELRTSETAVALGLTGTTDPALRDVDYGAWRGLAMSEVSADEIAVWLTDPTASPHGGESIVELIDRVRAWLDGVAESATPTLAVTHPAVVRAAVLLTLDAPPKSFWRIDIPPLSITRLHHRGAWTLRSTGFDSPRLGP